MRVAVVNAHISDCVGGSELQCHIIAKGLAARGHEVHYVAVRGAGRYAGLGYTVHPVPHSGRDIGNKCVEICPDVVYWRYNKFCFYRAARIIAKGDVPILFSVSAVADTEKWGGSGIARRRGGLRGSLRAFRSMALSRWNYQGFRFVAGLVVNNPEHLNRAPVLKQRYIPNGMIEDREAFVWGRRFVAWVANIKPGKRPEAFVKLASALAAHDIDCLMIGRIQDSNYDWLDGGRALPANLHYLGPKSPEEVNGILSEAALHVHTCLPEGFSNVFIQAWLQSCPSVSLDFDPGGYISTYGLGAYAEGDWDQFVEQVIRLLSDESERQAAGKRARAFAKNMFSVERLLDQVTEMLEAVVANRGSSQEVSKRGGLAAFRQQSSSSAEGRTR